MMKFTVELNNVDKLDHLYNELWVKRSDKMDGSRDMANQCEWLNEVCLNLAC